VRLRRWVLVAWALTRRRGSRRGRPGCRGRVRPGMPGRADELQRLPRRGLYDVRLGLAVRARCRRPGGRGRRPGEGLMLDAHTAGEGREGHGDQERCGGRRSMHPRNSAGSGPLWGADRRRMPHMGDPGPAVGGRARHPCSPVAPSMRSRIPDRAWPGRTDGQAERRDSALPQAAPAPLPGGFRGIAGRLPWRSYAADQGGKTELAPWTRTYCLRRSL
jgi:hypothetical protein